MNKATSFGLGLTFVLGFSLTQSHGARAAEPAPAPAAKADQAGDKAGTGKEVTLKGDLGCGKCNFKTTAECQNVLKVSEGGKNVMYYLAANDVSDKNHEAVCSGVKPATVTGTVAEQSEGKGAKKKTKRVLTASSIKLD